jgi:alanine dehydrogenase
LKACNGMPLQEGAITAEHIVGEVGELIAGKVVGRTDASEITLFKSVGAAVEDLCAAIAVYERATAEGEGEDGGSKYPRM